MAAYYQAPTKASKLSSEADPHRVSCSNPNGREPGLVSLAESGLSRNECIWQKSFNCVHGLLACTGKHYIVFNQMNISNKCPFPGFQSTLQFLHVPNYKYYPLPATGVQAIWKEIGTFYSEDAVSELASGENQGTFLVGCQNNVMC